MPTRCEPGSRRSLVAALLVLVVSLLLGPVPAQAGPCQASRCADHGPAVDTQPGALAAVYFEVRAGHGYAAGVAPAPPTHRWRLLAQCDLTDATVGGCRGAQLSCPTVPDRLLAYYIVQSQRLVAPDHAPVDGFAPPVDAAPATGYGPWSTAYAGCVDVTDLNPAPTPDEVYRYFRTLPLPQLAVQQQPPGGSALVGLPVIFFTTGPTTRNFTLDIRGFSVTIAAEATAFTWHTGDGTDLASTGPGAPYPRQTITHDYRSGTYTASLTTTWSGTFTVNGGPVAQVPGRTTTDGPPVRITVLQAHTELTNPYD